MDKNRFSRVIILICVSGMLFYPSYADTPHVIKKCVVEDLEKTIVYNPDKNSAQSNLIVTAQYFMNLYAKSRRDILSVVLPLFQLRSIDAVLEWGGGMTGFYTIVIIASDSICWIKWTGGEKFAENYFASTIGQVPLKNKYVARSFKEKINNLIDYCGSKPSRVSSEPSIFFMTFYKNNQPQKTFCSEIPRDDTVRDAILEKWQKNAEQSGYIVEPYSRFKNETEKKHHEILVSLFNEVVKLIKERNKGGL